MKLQKRFAVFRQMSTQIQHISYLPMPVMNVNTKLSVKKTAIVN